MSLYEIKLNRLRNEVVSEAVAKLDDLQAGIDMAVEQKWIRLMVPVLLNRALRGEA